MFLKGRSRSTNSIGSEVRSTAMGRVETVKNDRLSSARSGRYGY